MNEVSSFGAWLKQRRQALDLTQPALAQRVGCAVTTIQKIEAGERRPSRELADLLARLLDVPPAERAALVRLAREPQRGAAAGERGQSDRAGAQENAASLPLGRAPLPLPLTPLIGRTDEVAQVGALLRGGDVRLLTLVGPPGVGKTRLALQLAAELADHFGDGVVFVPLAPVRDPQRVLTTIARQLCLPNTDHLSPLDCLIAALHSHQLLLILDNFEQVLTAGPLLADLLPACPRLIILVTSRERLRVRGEHIFVVPPLGLPDLSLDPPVEEVAHAPAVALFVERARAAQPDFVLTGESALAVVAICRHLDGLPLAIELVAARTQLLAPAALLARLRASQELTALPLLAQGPRDLPPRQQSLREAITWSYDLLTPSERTLFVRLSVFVGGWTIAAAEAIGNALGDLPGEMLDWLSSLLDKSLLRLAEPGASRSDGPRFLMLETIREYALTALAATGEAALVHRWHAEYYLALAEAADLQLGGADQEAWLNRLDEDHDNLRAALAWALGAGAVEIAARLAVALRRFWDVRSYGREGRGWLEQILAQGDPLTPALRSRVLQAISSLALVEGDYERTIAVLAESLALERARGDPAGLADTLNNLGLAALHVGDFIRAGESLTESLALRQALADQWGIAAGCSNLGLVHLYQGDLPQAAALFRDSLARREALGDKRGIATAATNLGEVARQQGDYAQAQRLYAQGLSLFYELASKSDMIVCLAGLACIAADEARPEAAVRLFGAEEAVRESAGATIAPSDEAEYQRYLDLLRRQLGPERFAAGWAAGRALPLAQVVTAVLRASEGRAIA